MVNERVFLVYRQKTINSEPYYERYTVPVKPGMNVLEALFYIQDYYDSNFAFRYACRGAICGSCGMTIDKFPRLACKTQISRLKGEKVPEIPELKFGDTSNWIKDKEILIEPLPNMKIIKDLVVDMEPFWQFYREVQPYFIRNWNDVQPESKQTPEDIKIIEPLIYCILCGLCWTCPVKVEDKKYLAPASLAKAYRFIADTRISSKARDSIINRVLKEDGVPACEKFYVCNKVCPKGVMPGTAIRKIREL